MFTYSLGGKGGGPGWATMLIDLFLGKGGGGADYLLAPTIWAPEKNLQIYKKN